MYVFLVENGSIKRIADDDVQSGVLELVGENVAVNYITCPADPKKALGIKLPYIVLIVKNVRAAHVCLQGPPRSPCRRVCWWLTPVPIGCGDVVVAVVVQLKKYFTFEVQVMDDKNTKRRFRASNFQVSRGGRDAQEDMVEGEREHAAAFTADCGGLPSPSRFGVWCAGAAAVDHPSQAHDLHHAHATRRGGWGSGRRFRSLEDIMLSLTDGWRCCWWWCVGVEPHPDQFGGPGEESLRHAARRDTASDHPRQLPDPAGVLRG